MDDTRHKIIRAAERLMAERGVDNVTFAEITQAAGQRNNSAVPYHFSDRRGLIEAILEAHTTPIATRRVALLDTLGPTPTVRDLAEAFVRPIADELVQAEGGIHYVRVMSQLQSHPDIDPLDMTAPHRPVTERMTALLEQASPLDRDVLLVRVDLALTLVFHGLAERAGTTGPGALEPGGIEPGGIEPGGIEPGGIEFLVENLIDVVEATLCTPPSPRTEAARVPGRRGDRPLGKRSWPS